MPAGWLLIHHGVSEHPTDEAILRLDYAAGAMILDADDVTRVLRRTAEPLLAPRTTQEQAGIDRHTVFPSALAHIDGQRYLFYGVSDRHVGALIIALNGFLLDGGGVSTACRGSGGPMDQSSRTPARPASAAVPRDRQV